MRRTRRKLDLPELVKADSMKPAPPKGEDPLFREYGLPALYPELTTNQKRVIREQYYHLQKGKCWHCKFALNGIPSPEVQTARINRLLFPSGFFGNPVHLHHCHQTGMTIGAVHSLCNAYLFQYKGQ